MFIFLGLMSIPSPYDVPNFDNLIHPVHQRGKVKAYLIENKYDLSTYCLMFDNS